MECWLGLAEQHALTRSVRDSARLLDATHGAPPGAPYQPAPPPRPYAEELGAAPGRLRIAYTKSALLDERDQDPECIAAVEDAARLCADLGHEVTEAALPLDIPAIVDAFVTLTGAEGAFEVAESERLTGRRVRPGDVELVTWIIRLIGRKRTAADLDRAFDVMRRTSYAVAIFMEGYDVILSSTLAQPPWPIGELALSASERGMLQVVRRMPARPVLASVVKQLAGEILRPMPNTPLCNLTGQPAMSVPLYWSRDGLPVGVQFIGRQEEEWRLFRLASQLEAARPWWERRPALAG
jgi:amidase